MIKGKRYILLATVLATVSLLLLLRPVAYGEEGPGNQTVRVEGIDRMWGDTEGETTFLEGELVITKGDTVIYASYAEVEKTGDGRRIARLSRGVRVVCKETTVQGEELTFDLDNDYGVLTGDVRLERREKRNEAGEVEKDRIVLTCAVLEIDTVRNNFTAGGDVFLEHEDFTVTAARLTYEDAGEILFFSGGFLLSREKEDLQGQNLQIDLKEKIFKAWEQVELVFEVDGEEENGEQEGENREEDGKE